MAAEFHIFCKEQPFAAARRPGLTTLPIEERLLRDPQQAPETSLARALRDYAPDLLIVDMFWAPLRHILPLPGSEAWLLVRTAPENWLLGPTGLPFAATQYRRILAIEPLLRPPPVPVEQLEPIVICNPDECQPETALKSRLGVPVDRPLTLVVHAGKPGEREILERDARAGSEAVEVADLFADQDQALFPVAPWLAGADRIVGGCGYNLFWETRWLGLAGRTSLRGFPRPIDNQFYRLSLGAHRVRENGADVLARSIG